MLWLSECWSQLCMQSVDTHGGAAVARTAGATWDSALDIILSA